MIFISYHNEITMLEFMLKRREDFIVNKATRFSVAGELE
ncbi:EamA family transporter RarD, partial [Salmonella enterica]|nr:EamA family transporter RarD [Salmonella enterica]